MRPVCGHDNYVNGCPECQLYSVRPLIGGLQNANKGLGAAGHMTDREYVRDMYEKRRAQGLPDPEPMNSKSAALAPGKGIYRKVGE